MLRPAEFVVETVEAGLGEVLVYIEDPEGHTEEVSVKFNIQKIFAQIDILQVLMCVFHRPESFPTMTETEATPCCMCQK